MIGRPSNFRSLKLRTQDFLAGEGTRGLLQYRSGETLLVSREHLSSKTQRVQQLEETLCKKRESFARKPAWEEFIEAANTFAPQLSEDLEMVNRQQGELDELEFEAGATSSPVQKLETITSFRREVITASFHRRQVTDW